jgi:hypothetical protein
MELTISSPCPKRWEDLVGDNRIRFCGECRLNVYNLTVMKAAEIERLVTRTSGRLCVQIYVRQDQTATLRDCRVGREGVFRRRIRTVGAAFLVLFFGLVSRSLGRPDLSGWPNWVQVAAEWIDPGIPPFRRTMGAPRPIKPPPAPSTTILCPTGNTTQ